MDIKRLFGEISEDEVIEVGDNVRVVYYEEGKEKEDGGVLIQADKEKILINGTSPKKEIEVKNIISIKKIVS